MIIIYHTRGYVNEKRQFQIGIAVCLLFLHCSFKSGSDLYAESYVLVTAYVFGKRGGAFEGLRLDPILSEIFFRKIEHLDIVYTVSDDLSADRRSRAAVSDLSAGIEEPALSVNGFTVAVRY